MSHTALLWIAWLVLGACLVCLVGNVYATEPALIRSSLIRPGPVWVRQRVSIKVELLTTTFFAGAPVFQLPTIPQAVLMQIEDRPVLGTEQIDDTTYTVQQHELALFVLRPGVYEVPPFIMRFASAPRYSEPPIGWDVEHQTLMQATLPALTLEIVAPSCWRLWWVVGAGLVLAAGAAVGWRQRHALLGTR